MSDVVRYMTILVCLFNVGVMFALWERTGRLWLPKVWMRMLMASNVVQLTIVALGAYARLGHPMTWRTPILTVGAALELVALVGLYRWYGSKKGREHSERMTRGGFLEHR